MEQTEHRLAFFPEKHGFGKRPVIIVVVRKNYRLEHNDLTFGLNIICSDDVPPFENPDLMR
jgi:hypothetical protein